MSKKVEINNGMGFFRWLYLGIVLMRIANVIDWDWRIILAPPAILIVISLLYMLYPKD